LWFGTRRHHWAKRLVNTIRHQFYLAHLGRRQQDGWTVFRHDNDACLAAAIHSIRLRLLNQIGRAYLPPKYGQRRAEQVSGNVVPHWRSGSNTPVIGNFGNPCATAFVKAHPRARFDRHDHIDVVPVLNTPVWGFIDVISMNARQHRFHDAVKNAV